MFMCQQNISPGAVLTDMILDFIKNQDESMKGNILQDKDIADAVIYALGTSERVEVSTNTDKSRHFVTYFERINAPYVGICIRSIFFSDP